VIVDPYEYRRKRDIMTVTESLEHDRNKVTLIASLGNAGLESSFEYIVSHINSTNSQWIKRTGVYALRKFTHEQVPQEKMLNKSRWKELLNIAFLFSK